MNFNKPKENDFGFTFLSFKSESMTMDVAGAVSDRSPQTSSFFFFFFTFFFFSQKSFFLVWEFLV